MLRCKPAVLQLLISPPSQIGLNSFEGISPADLLALHTIYYKKIKQM
jgi:hypothetical protein